MPALTQPTGSTEAPLRTWVAHQHDDGAKVLGVCSGSLVLASTGMLDGLHATSHWSRISALQASRPAVHWIRGRRYVEDGSVTTTAAVTSGVPAALHLVAELAGPAEAQRVAGLHPELGWSPTETTGIPDDHFAVPDWPVGLNFLEPWLRPTIGVALRDGVGELDATAGFEVYGQSAAARTLAIAATDTIRTRHGLVLLTTPLTHATDLSRVVVPGADKPDAIDPQLRTWADSRRLTVEPLAGRPGPDGSQGGGGRVHRSPAESCRPHRCRHHIRDRQDGRLPDHRPHPRLKAPVLADGPARPRQPDARRPHRTSPGPPGQAPAATFPPARQRPHRGPRGGLHDQTGRGRERQCLNLDIDPVRTRPPTGARPHR